MERNATKGDNMATYEAINPKNGLRVRMATEEEKSAYLNQPCKHPLLRKNIMVNGMLIQERIGEGVSAHWGVNIWD
jgi:hypothetical protein